MKYQINNSAKFKYLKEIVNSYIKNDGDLKLGVFELVLVPLKKKSKDT